MESVGFEQYKEIAIILSAHWEIATNQSISRWRNSNHKAPKPLVATLVGENLNESGVGKEMDVLIGEKFDDLEDEFEGADGREFPDAIRQGIAWFRSQILSPDCRETENDGRLCVLVSRSN